jgi:hypothetical protein
MEMPVQNTVVEVGSNARAPAKSNDASVPEADQAIGPIIGR